MFRSEKDINEKRLLLEEETNCICGICGAHACAHVADTVSKKRHDSRVKELKSEVDELPKTYGIKPTSQNMKKE